MGGFNKFAQWTTVQIWNKTLNNWWNNIDDDDDDDDGYGYGHDENQWILQSTQS